MPPLCMFYSLLKSIPVFVETNNWHHVLLDLIKGPTGAGWRFELSAFCLLTSELSVHVVSVWGSSWTFDSLTSLNYCVNFIYSSHQNSKWNHTSCNKLTWSWWWAGVWRRCTAPDLRQSGRGSATSAWILCPHGLWERTDNSVYKMAECDIR